MNLKGALFFFFVFLIALAASLKLHTGKPRFTWESEIWADRAGYYVYLPAAFLYRFDASEFPKNIDAKTGYGFFIDPVRNAVVTQYYYGESLLLSPFFLATRLIHHILNLDEEGGFSLVYHRAMNLAAIFYLLLGLYFLQKFLLRYHKPVEVYLVLTALFLGTNLFFYTAEDSLMSHVYSFFAVSMFLFFMKKFLDEQRNYFIFIGMIVSFSLMVVIRPTNAMVGISFFFWDAGCSRDILQRIRMLIRPKYVLPLVLILVVVFLPQAFYWKYAHGSYLYLTYGSDFTHWTRPRLLEVWFSTLNGLFVYSPVVLFFVAGTVVMILQKKINGAVALFIFLVVSWIAASYRYWYYGCSFGHRAFVEIYPLLCLPAASFAGMMIGKAGKTAKGFIVTIILIFITMNLGLTLFGDKCNEGSVWDRDQLSRELFKAGLIPAALKSDRFRNDFENAQISTACPSTDLVSRSGDNGAVIRPGDTGCLLYSCFLRDLKMHGKIAPVVSFWIYGQHPEKAGLFLTVSVKTESIDLFHKDFPIQPEGEPEAGWTQIRQEIVIPDVAGSDTYFKIELHNHSLRKIFLDDLQVEF